jgi:Domain of Unknown Function (DUF1080)
MNRQTKLRGADRVKAAAPLLPALLLIALAFLPYSPGLRAQAKNQAKAPAKGKWVTLFDGKSMANWTPQGDANWRLMDGAAVADKGMGYLVSKNSYTDFEVRAEFWVSDNANSGVFIRCADPQKVTADNCYEVNIFDQRPDPTYGTGAITNVAKPSVFLKAGGKWNTYDITAQGPHMVIVLNGTKTVDVENSKLPSGPIALQAFAGTVKFRKVQIKPL